MDTTYTTGQVAAVLGVNVKTVRAWIDSGKLPGMRLPDENDQGERRVHPDVLREFLEKIGYTRMVQNLPKPANGKETELVPEEKANP